MPVALEPESLISNKFVTKGLATWLMENDFQPQMGHEFTLHGRYGPVPCQVLEIDPPHRLSFAWDNFGWHVSFELTELEGRTRFTVIQAGWGEPDEIVPRAFETNSKVRDIMDFGWGHPVRDLHDKLDKDEE